MEAGSFLFFFYQVLVVRGSANPGLGSQASCCRDCGSEFSCYTGSDLECWSSQSLNELMALNTG